MSSLLYSVLKAAVLSLAFFMVFSSAQADALKAAHLTVELLSDRDSIASAEKFNLAVRFQVEKGWHIYWKNPGDSGLAPKFTFRLPDSFSRTELKWPAPERIPFGPLVNYGYRDEVFIILPVTASSELGGMKDAQFSLNAEWVVCKEECIPGNGVLELHIPLSKKEKGEVSKWAPSIEEALKAVPQELKWLRVSASVEAHLITLNISSDSPSLPDGQLVFIPEFPGMIEGAAEQIVERNSSGLKMLLTKAYGESDLREISGLLMAKDGWPATDGVKAAEIAAPIAGAALDMKEKTAASSYLWILLLSSFLGGMILNLMPCVLPVISIKIVFFLEQARENPAKLKAHGLLYSAGVIASFWCLAAIFLAFRSAGQELGWGFQLQSPAFVLTMAFLLFVVAMNLLGVFEVGASLQNLSSRLMPEDGQVSSFGSGVLATILATPCSAPFVGTAIAVAALLHPLSAFLVFTALGAGLAAPYLALSWIPSLSRVLPKPGIWMLYFKRVMAVPVLLTVMWLVWVFRMQTDFTSTLWLCAGLCIAAMSLWIFGSYSTPLNQKYVRMTSSLAAVLLFVISVSLALPADVNYRNFSAEYTEDAHGLKWEKYSREKLDAYRQEHRPVFVDFTAAWCITCQVNKRLAFGSSAVIEYLKGSNIALLRGDWTSRDPRIAAEIASFGRSGVPLNILFKSNPNIQPHIFPAIISPGSLLEELKDAEN